MNKKDICFLKGLMDSELREYENGVVCYPEFTGCIKYHRNNYLTLKKIIKQLERGV